MSTENNSIGIFIGWSYFAKIYEAFEDNFFLNFQKKMLLLLVCMEITRLHELDLDNCYITESHYFKGRYRANDVNSKYLMFKECKLEDTLIVNDVISHYKNLFEEQNDYDIIVIEKGGDVWLALEAYALTMFRNFDSVVLITDDADYEIQVKQLKLLEIYIALLIWNMTKQLFTAKFLCEEACLHVEMSDMMVDGKEFLNSLCRKV